MSREWCQVRSTEQKAQYKTCPRVEMPLIRLPWDLYGIIFVYFRFRFSIASAQSIPFVSYTYVDVLYSHQHIGFSFYRLVCAYYQAERFRGRAFVLRKSYFKLRTQSLYNNSSQILVTFLYPSHMITITMHSSLCIYDQDKSLRNEV